MTPSRSRAPEPTDLPDVSGPEPSSPPSPPRPLGTLAFRQPESDPTSDPSPWPEGDASPSASDEPSGLLDGPSDAPPRSSRASSAGDGTPVLSKSLLRDAFREGVEVVGDNLHELLARDEAERMVDLYRADEKDARAIGDPLANIAHRHSALGDIANPDLGDAIACMIGLAMYAVKQLKRRAAAKQLRRGPVPVAADGRTDATRGDGTRDGSASGYGAENG